MKFETLEYIFTEVNNITITWDRIARLYKATYYIGNNKWTFGCGDNISDAISCLDKNLKELNKN